MYFLIQCTSQLLAIVLNLGLVPRIEEELQLSESRVFFILIFRGRLLEIGAIYLGNGFIAFFRISFAKNTTSICNN